MRNSNQENFRAINSMPMSKGTRVHQLAMYVVFTVPIQMLSDNPTIDFSFLYNGNFKAEIFSDGINADRDATDYKREVVDIKKGDKLKVKMMNGGGWAAILTPGPGGTR